MPRINLDGLKDSPMVIDHCQSSPDANHYEYEYHSAEKGGGAAIETSMQSYRMQISRHRGSAAKKLSKAQNS
jgi:hypothetical protein